MRIKLPLALLALLAASAAAITAAEPFRPLDVFELEWASDPRISPDGGSVAYVRNYFDVMTDRSCADIWRVAADGGDHRPLVAGGGCHGSPRWSPDGKRLLYTSSADGDTQLWMRWMDSGQAAPISRLTRSPDDLAWSPDGRWIAFTMFVERRAKPLVEPPPKPEGANWADPPRVIEKLIYRADGSGYLEDGYRHLFLLAAEGGTPRQLTTGDFHHGSTPVWAPDGESLLISANRHAEWEHEPLDREIYEVRVADGAVRALTDRRGPDDSPAVSPSGRQVAYVGFDDRRQGYQLERLYVMNRDGSGSRLLTGGLDLDVRAPVWAGDGSGIFFRTSIRGNGKIGFVGLDGKVEILAGDLGGVSLGRPYASGSSSVSDSGRYAYTETRPDHPADVAVGDAAAGGGRRVTRLNDDLLANRALAPVEEIRFASAHDGREIQGWVAKPPGFEPDKRYPLILEIHGGPFADYGDRWAAEVQLYAAAGYLVLYVNPRGSTSYGEEFGNLIHHNYPGEDYDDLMSGVDAVIARGWADPERLYVTGGSGGGVLTAWIVGKTDRFRAAVSAKPVINWYSFALTADAYNFFHRYWFPGFPWDEPEAYLARSPLSLVGNVTTPTMLLTGEQDYRTPMSESEQFYQALKLRKVPAALVRVPGASHGIARRPSQLIAKVQHVLAWFERWAPADD